MTDEQKKKLKAKTKQIVKESVPLTAWAIPFHACFFALCWDASRGKIKFELMIYVSRIYYFLF